MTPWPTPVRLLLATAVVVSVEVLADEPDLERADIEQALQYAAWLASEQILAG